jgi:cysteine-rich repeat protein
MKIKKLSIKFISIILLISLLIGIGDFILFKPKIAKSQFIPGVMNVPVGEVANTGPQFIKENILDAIVKAIAKTFMQQMIGDITRWAAGGFSDTNQPFAVTNWTEYLKTAINVGSGMFINEFNLTPLCSPIRISLEGLGLITYHVYLPPYTQYAACTIGDIVENVEDFWKNPSIGMYGWDTWSALTQPQNNLYGAYLLATEERARLETEQSQAKQQEATVSGGYQNQAICTKDDVTACKSKCAEQGPPSPECLKRCEKSSIGICIEQQTKTTGSEIHAAIEKAIGADIDWIVSADEISELLGAFITGITQRLISGFYNYQTPSQVPSPRRPTTPAETQKTISDVKEGVFENIKQISQNINQINPESQLSMTEIANMLLSLFEERTIQLYSIIEGIDPKVDSVIPDKYPLQVADWISQAIVKYPLVAKTNICVGSQVKILTEPCQAIPASEIEFLGSCSIESIDPDCPNCVNPLCLLTFASIRNYSRFCEALSADDSYCAKGTVVKPKSYCGDGVLDAGEECDDGNNISGDGCSATCELEEGQ